MPIKYPRTPYWPTSPSVAVDGRIIEQPERLLGVSVMATEKLDGSNTLLHRGEVYGRSVSSPSVAKWHAMVKKYHAWKLADSDVYLYGEDIFGVHSIEYDAVPAWDTFYAFAMRYADGSWASFWEMEEFALERRISVVPIVLLPHKFESMFEVETFLRHEHCKVSKLGGEREGIVLRLTDGFPDSEFANSVAKSVRPNHVQTDEHWTKNWQLCKLL